MTNPYLTSYLIMKNKVFPVRSGTRQISPICGLGAGGKGDDRGWDGWMASLTWWTWVWVNSERWWWTGRRGILWFMGSQTVRHDWVTELIQYVIESPRHNNQTIRKKIFLSKMEKSSLFADDITLYIKPETVMIFFFNFILFLNFT